MPILDVYPGISVFDTNTHITNYMPNQTWAKCYYLQYALIF